MLRLRIKDFLVISIYWKSGMEQLRLLLTSLALWVWQMLDTQALK